MKLSIQREALLKPLQLIGGVVERRQTLPILANVLLEVKDDRLWLTGTDLEVELVAQGTPDNAESGEITLPARKFLDICRALPEHASVGISIENDRAVLRSGKSRFTLATLPANEFPNIETVRPALQFKVPQRDLKRLFERTHFAMAQQDVRYYLNGLLLEIETGTLRAVATDGHRLSLCEMAADVNSSETLQVIIPRKGVLELTRLLEDSDETVEVQIGTNHIRVSLPETIFTSKLIDGRFPDYRRVLPQNPDKIMLAEREALRQVLSRASILSNEKYRGVRLQLSTGSLKVEANNPELEEAEEEFEVDYQGGGLEIGFNVNYFLDALGVIDTSEVQIAFSDPNSSCLIQPIGSEACKYVVMPMRL